MSEQGRRSFKVRAQLEQAHECGCYYCLRIYSPKDIEEWVDANSTAICPFCGIDAVVPFINVLDYDRENFITKLNRWHKESFRDE